MPPCQPTQYVTLTCSEQPAQPTTMLSAASERSASHSVYCEPQRHGYANARPPVPAQSVLAGLYVCLWLLSGRLLMAGRSVKSSRSRLSAIATCADGYHSASGGLRVFAWLTLDVKEVRCVHATWAMPRVVQLDAEAKLVPPFQRSPLSPNTNRGP